jgi:hypothetical protein
MSSDKLAMKRKVVIMGAPSVGTSRDSLPDLNGRFGYGGNPCSRFSQGRPHSPSSTSPRRRTTNSTFPRLRPPRTRSSRSTGFSTSARSSTRPGR